MLGFIVMVDSTARKPRETFDPETSVRMTRYVALPTQDREDAWDIDDMRHALRLDSKVKFLPCVATDKATVKSVLLELLYSILAEMESGR
jgi:signal recognition particle receptor subunit beta